MSQTPLLTDLLEVLAPSPTFVGPSLAPSQPSLLSGPTQSSDKPWALRNQTPPLLDFPSRAKPRPSGLSPQCGCLLSRHSISLRKRLFPAQQQTYFSQMKHLLKKVPLQCSKRGSSLFSKTRPCRPLRLSPAWALLNPGPNVGRTEGDILRCEAPLQNPADGFLQ